MPRERDQDQLLELDEDNLQVCGPIVETRREVGLANSIAGTVHTGTHGALEGRVVGMGRICVRSDSERRARIGS